MSFKLAFPELRYTLVILKALLYIYISLGDYYNTFITKGSDYYFYYFFIKNIYYLLLINIVFTSFVFLEVLASYYPKSNKALATKVALIE